MAKLKEGVTAALNPIQKKMLPVVTLPLPEDCPTGLRYALAKYAATSVTEAWEGLKELEVRGDLVNAE